MLQKAARIGSWISELTSILSHMINKTHKRKSDKDMTKKSDKDMTLEEVIVLAYAEFSGLFESKDSLEILRGSDDGGKTLDFKVAGDDHAAMLRNKLPYMFNGYGTVVIFSYEPDYELNEDSERF